MFRNTTKAEMDAMFEYMADFNEVVPDIYDYTSLFGLWKWKQT